MSLPRNTLLLLAALALSSCGLLKPRTVIEYRDSIRVEEHYTTQVKDSIIYVTLPDEQAAALLQNLRVPSHLETSLAESDAWVDSLGLHHTLRNRDRQWGVHVPVTTRTVKSAAEHQSSITNTVKVPAELKPWDRIRIKAFLPLLVLCLLGFRKEILALIKYIAKFVC